MPKHFSTSQGLRAVAEARELSILHKKYELSEILLTFLTKRDRIKVQKRKAPERGSRKAERHERRNEIYESTDLANTQENSEETGGRSDGHVSLPRKTEKTRMECDVMKRVLKIKPILSPGRGRTEFGEGDSPMNK